MKAALSSLLLLSTLVCFGCDNTTTQTPDPVLQDPTTDSTYREPVDEGEVDSEITREEVRTQAEQAIETASQFAHQEQQEYRQQVYSRLDKIQHHVDALKEQLGKGPVTTTKSELQQTLTRLEQQISETRQQSEQEKGETQEAWSQLKSTIDETVQELESSTERARQQLENETPAEPTAASAAEQPPETAPENPENE